MKKLNQSTALNVFQYDGNKISFKTVSGQVMINANEMAKSFNEKPDNFLRNKKTKEYINVLCQFSNMRTEQVVKVVNGGSHNGTWLHELIALRFAQWLSPHFSIWVDKHIKELLTTGQTKLNNENEHLRIQVHFMQRKINHLNEMIVSDTKSINTLIRLCESYRSIKK